MTLKKTRDLAAVFFVGLFVLTFEPVFIWLLIGAMVLLQPEEKSKSCMRKSKSRLLQISEDAKKHGLRMPKRQNLRSLLVQIYQNLESSKKDYPHLKNEYDEIIHEMWGSLAAEETFEHWNMILTSVLAGWPKRKNSGTQSVHSKLKEVTKLTEQWDDAKREAFGGSHV